MKTKFTLTILVLLTLAPNYCNAQWTQIGYMIVNGDTIKGGHQFAAFNNKVYCCTDSGLFVSGDNGITWLNLTFNKPNILNESIYSMTVASNGDMYAGSYYRLFKSIDNGVSWNWMDGLPDSLHMNGIAQTGGNIVVSYSTDFSTGGGYYSSNAGSTWSASAGLTAPMHHFLTDSPTLYLGGSLGVYKSTDNGISFTAAGFGFPLSFLVFDVVKSDGAFFAGDVSGNGLFGSYDNALSWSNADTVLFTGFCQVFSLTEANHMVLAVMDGGCNGGAPLKMSADTGHTWNPFMTGLPLNYYSILGRNSAGTSFFTKEGNGQKVYRYGGATDVSSIAATVDEFTLYPNPAFGECHARFTLPSSAQKSSLLIYDVTGRLVKSIPIEDKATEITFSIANFTEGTYFCSLKSNRSTEVKKLLVVK